MQPLSIRCPVCGNENLFPPQYAGRTLSCSHCGEPLPVSGDKSGPAAQAVSTKPETSQRETGLRRLMRFLCHGLCIVCCLVLGAAGGGWAGIELAFRLGVLGYVIALVTCPAGGFLGLWVGRWLGRGMGRFLGSYRLSLPGMLLGFGGGLLYWGQSVESPYSRFWATELAWNEWLLLSVSLAVAGLAAAFLAMLVDALFSFTR